MSRPTITYSRKRKNGGTRSLTNAPKKPKLEELLPSLKQSSLPSSPSSPVSTTMPIITTPSTPPMDSGDEGNSTIDLSWLDSPPEKPQNVVKKTNSFQNIQRKRTSPSRPVSSESTVWAIQEQGNTIAVEDDLTDLLEGIDPLMCSDEEDLLSSTVELVVLFLNEARALRLLANRPSACGKLRNFLIAPSGDLLSFWKISLLMILLRDCSVAHSLFTPKLLERILPSSALEEFSPCSSLSSSPSSSLDDSKSNSPIPPSPLKSETEIPVTAELLKSPSKSAMGQRRFGATNLLKLLTQRHQKEEPPVDTPPTATFINLIFLELIGSGCLRRQELRSRPVFFDTITQELRLSLCDIEARSSRTQLEPFDSQLTFLRVETALQLLEDLSDGAENRFVIESGSVQAILELMETFVKELRRTQPQKTSGGLVRSTSDPTKTKRNQRKNELRTFKSQASFMNVPAAGQISRDAHYISDCLIACERVLVNLTNHNSDMSKILADSESKGLRVACSIFSFPIMESKRVDAHLLSIAIILNVFESFPPSRTAFRVLQVNTTPVFAYFSRLLLENIPSQLENVTEWKTTKASGNIISAYLLMLLAIASLDCSENRDEIKKNLEKLVSEEKKKHLEELLNKTTAQVSKIFQEGKQNEVQSHGERDALLASLIGEITQDLAFNW